MNNKLSILLTNPTSRPRRLGRAVTRLSAALLAMLSTALPAADFATRDQYA